MRLTDLKPEWQQIYKDRHLTIDRGGIPTEDYSLSFICPSCGSPCTITINIGPKPKELQHV